MRLIDADKLPISFDGHTVGVWKVDLENALTVDTVDTDKAMEFIQQYAFVDKEEVYTNGSQLVPLFRVKQALIDKAYKGLCEGGE